MSIRPRRLSMLVMTLARIVLLVSAGCQAAMARAADMPLTTADRVELARYQGKWFEIGRLPLIWENKCASNVVASYALLADGNIDVLNSCRKANGEVTSSHGVARRSAQDVSGAKLKVTFFWPFAGDYWILRLDPSYQWALVGAPSRKYLWILSRTPTLDQTIVERLLKEARDAGFDVTRFQKTKQT